MKSKEQNSLQDTDISNVCAAETLNEWRSDVFNNPIAKSLIEKTVVEVKDDKKFWKTECARCGQCVLRGLTQEGVIGPACIYY